MDYARIRREYAKTTINPEHMKLIDGFTSRIISDLKLQRPRRQYELNINNDNERECIKMKYAVEDILSKDVIGYEVTCSHVNRVTCSIDVRPN